MNRRKAVQQLLLLTAGARWLSSCVNAEPSPERGRSPGLVFAEDEKRTVAALSEAILPASVHTGSKTAAADFMLRMISDCASPEEQQEFRSGLQSFRQWVQKKWGKEFADAKEEEQQSLIREIDTKKDNAEPLFGFYQQVKQASLQYYLGSEYYMTAVLGYNILPGPYQGCVPLTIK